MSDLDPGFDRLIAGAVNDYQETTMQFIKPEGTGSAITTANHRRKVRIASAVAGVAVATIGAGAGYSALAPGENAPPPAAHHSASPSPSASPSAAPTSPSASATATTATRAGSGAGIHGPDNLDNATLNLPANYTSSCPHGPTKFSNGTAGSHTKIEKVLAADVDHDGNSDDVALISCRIGEGALKQVVVFDRAAGGKFTTMGLVVQVDRKPIYNVDDMKVDGSRILARVGDQATTYTDGARLTGVFQWRTYGWNGSKFTQTAGSTSFQADKTANHLTTTVSKLVFGAEAGGKRTGTMTVTVRNTGTRSVSQVSLVMAMVGADALATPTGCPTVQVGDATVPTCQIGTLAAGASKTVTLTTTIPESEAEYRIAGGGLPLPESDAQVRIGDRKYSDTTGVTVTFD